MATRGASWRRAASSRAAIRTAANLEIVSGGYRNIYDFAFDGNGEIFTYDSDMEWDMGMPWYRPTRIVHADQRQRIRLAFRLGQVARLLPRQPAGDLNVGPGSPTGMRLRHRREVSGRSISARMFAMDWSFGTLYAVHLQPKGASYAATKEVFLSGNALPLAEHGGAPAGRRDVLRDRAVAARQRALSRDLHRAPNRLRLRRRAPLTELQKLRRELETHHRPNDPAAVAAAWPLLDHEDRYLRYAARIAMEHQPVARVAGARAGRNAARARLREAVIALVPLRRGQGARAALIDQLLTQEWAALGPRRKLAWLRACGSVFIRLGEPDPATAQKLLAAHRRAIPARRRHA